MGAVDVLRAQLRERRPALSPNEIQSRVAGLQTQLADLIETQAQLLIEQWRTDHPGQDPEFEELRSLHTRARMIANEVLSDQLQEQTQSLDETELPLQAPAAEQLPAARPGSAVHQWMHEDLWVEASRDSDWLAEKLWADKPPAWVVRAASLIEAMTIDGLTLPRLPGDPAARAVEVAVAADLSKSPS